MEHTKRSGNNLGPHHARRHWQEEWWTFWNKVGNNYIQSSHHTLLYLERAFFRMEGDLLKRVGKGGLDKEGGRVIREG